MNNTEREILKHVDAIVNEHGIEVWQREMREADGYGGERPMLPEDSIDEDDRYGRDMWREALAFGGSTTGDFALEEE